MLLFSMAKKNYTAFTTKYITKFLRTCQVIRIFYIGQIDFEDNREHLPVSRTDKQI